MASLRTLVVIVAVVVATGSQLHQAWPSGRLGNMIDQLKSGIFKIPADYLGASYNMAAEFGAKMAGMCKVEKYEDADACRNVSEIIRSRGFEVEEYDVITKDGYILNTQRVINPLVDPKYRSKKRPVVIEPGISTTSVDYVINSLYARPMPWPPADPSQWTDNLNEVLTEVEEDRKHPRSLAFYLANRGYDVFLGNNRGTVLGQRHVNLTRLDAEFWDFSFDEFIDYDVPATIEFVQHLTGHKKIAWIGWSQGASTMMGLQSDHPEYADVIEPFVVMSPTAFLGHIMAKYKVFFPIFSPLAYANQGIFFSYLSKYVFSHLGGGTRLQRWLFNQLVGYPILGKDTKGLQHERLPTYLRFVPSGTSMKNFVHYCQIYQSKKFERLNMGKAGNRLRYGQDYPPEYDVSRMRSKSIVFFTAETDYLGDPKDTDILLSKMTVKPYKWFNMTKEVPEWSHVSFIYHKRVGVLVNKRIYEVLEEFP